MTELKTCDTELLALVEHAPSVNDAWTEWLEAVNSCIDRNALKRVIKHFKEPPLDNQVLRSLQKAKLKANRCAKRSEKVSDWTTYRKLRNLVQSTCHKNHKSFIQELGLPIKTNPPKIWSYVKSKTGSGAMFQDMFLKGEMLSTPESQDDSFRKYFQSNLSNYDKPSDSLDCERKRFTPRINYSD